MPHTSRRRCRFQTSQSTGLTAAEEAEGWSRIPIRPRSSRNSNSKKTATVKSPLFSALSTSGIATNHTSHQALRKELDLYTTRWKASECRERIAGRISSHYNKTYCFPSNTDDNGDDGGESRGITTAVCLGLGNISSFPYDPRCLWQLSCYLDLCAVISSLSSNRVSIYIQDPRFTSQDRKFLSSLDITVLPTVCDGGDPNPAYEILYKAAQKTLIFAPFLSNVVEMFYLSLYARSSLFVTVGMDELERWLDERGPRRDGRIKGLERYMMVGKSTLNNDNGDENIDERNGGGNEDEDLRGESGDTAEHDENSSGDEEKVDYTKGIGKARWGEVARSSIKTIKEDFYCERFYQHDNDKKECDYALDLNIYLNKNDIIDHTLSEYFQEAEK